MNGTTPDNPCEDVNTQAEHFYRVVRRGSGAQQVTREIASLDELRHEARVLLEGLDPATFHRQPNAVTITGTRDGEEVTLTVQYFVAQPTDVWAPASGGPATDWSAWHDTVAQEARQLGWYVRGFHQETDDA